jgi:hypothetical protein
MRLLLLGNNWYLHLLFLLQRLISCEELNHLMTMYAGCVYIGLVTQLTSLSQ